MTRKIKEFPNPDDVPWFFIFLMMGTCSGVYFEPQHYFISGSIGGLLAVVIWGLLHTKDNS